MTTQYYAITTIRNPRTGGLDTIGGDSPITDPPEEVKARLEKVMQAKHGKDFVSVEITTTPRDDRS